MTIPEAVKTLDDFFEKYPEWYEREPFQKACKVMMEVGDQLLETAKNKLEGH